VRAHKYIYTEIGFFLSSCIIYQQSHMRASSSSLPAVLTPDRLTSTEHREHQRTAPARPFRTASARSSRRSAWITRGRTLYPPLPVRL